MPASKIIWPKVWRIGESELTLESPCLMGVLNVTPDSFSDGGRFRSADEAVDEATRMIEEGARIIDVGPESTRPGAQRVNAAEQIARSAPVIERIHYHHPQALTSIDTTLASVAEAALDAGACIINDVSAGREDERMFSLAAARGAGLILMHRLRPPDRDRFSDQYDEPPAYEDVVGAVTDFLRDRITEARLAGVDSASIVIDPGLGFGKTVRQNYELIARAEELATLGRPMLSAASRKSFIGAVDGGVGPADRLPGSLAITARHHRSGVRLFRVHDVAAHRQALAVTAASDQASNA